MILFVVEPEVTVAGPQTSDRDDPLSGDGVAGDVDDVEPDEGQLREADLQLEGLLPDGVEGVARGHLGFVLAAVSGKTNHLKSALFEYFFFTKRSFFNLNMMKTQFFPSSTLSF